MLDRLPVSIIALALSLTAQAAEPPQLLRIHAADPGVREQLGLIAGHFRYDRESGIATVEADALARDRLTRLGLDWDIDVAGTAAMRAFVDAGLHGLRAIPGYACYRTVEETFDTMDSLVADYPRLASIVDIGDSWRRSQDIDDGYPIRVLKLGNAAIDGDKPVFFAMSSVHAREYTPAELMTRFAEQLLAGYGVDADSTWLLDHHEFHLLLQANPDGRKRAEQAVLWRKNENQNHCPQSNGDPDGNDHPGVDLNRNFPWNWAPPQFSQCSGTFPGLSAASEPETQAIGDYVRSIFPDTRPGTGLSDPADDTTRGLFLDMHSYTGLVLWPWGTPGTTGNDAAFTRLGRRLAWFNDYEPQQAIELYPTRGTTIDFAYGELGIPGFTFELGTAFFQDCAAFESTILPDNLAALRYAARTLQAPYRLPAGPDAFAAMAEPGTVIQGDLAEITATIDDSRYQDGPGSVPVHAIQGADVYIDELPWAAGATAVAMTAQDGSFNEPMEQVVLALDTARLAPGRHRLMIQGHDGAGERGPPTALFLDVGENTDLIFLDDFEPGGPLSQARSGELAIDPPSSGSAVQP